jgi:hypothetical protein
MEYTVDSFARDRVPVADQLGSGNSKGHVSEMLCVFDLLSKNVGNVGLAGDVSHVDEPKSLP